MSQWQIVVLKVIAEAKILAEVGRYHRVARLYTSAHEFLGRATGHIRAAAHVKCPVLVRLGFGRTHRLFGRSFLAAALLACRRWRWRRRLLLGWWLSRSRRLR